MTEDEQLRALSPADGIQAPQRAAGLELGPSDLDRAAVGTDTLAERLTEEERGQASLQCAPA